MQEKSDHCANEGYKLTNGTKTFNTSTALE
jgi:hypothetical protein